MTESEEMQFVQPDVDEALSQHVLGAGHEPAQRRAPAPVAPARGCRLPFGLVATRTW